VLLLDFGSTNRAALTGLKEVKVKVEAEKREDVGRVGNSTSGFPITSSFDKLMLR